MSEIKNKWDTKLYEDKHAFVWEYGSNLIEILAPKEGESILDLGCGTGQLTNQIAETGAEVVGIDNSSEMIAKASTNYPNLNFAIADGTNFAFEEQFDAVFSNAALHWIKPPEAAIECIQQVLKPGGRLVAEFGGKGNVEQIINAINEVIEENKYAIASLINPWYFPSIGEYSTLLEQAGLEVNYATLFERLTPLKGGEEGMKNWLTMFAGSIIEDIKSDRSQKIIAAIEKKLSPNLWKDYTWFADYKRIRIIAKKKNY